VPYSALKQSGWLQKGWKNFTEQFPGERDFWIANFTARASRLELFEGQTPELGPAMRGLRWLLAMAEGCTAEQAHEYTWHSCKCTIIDRGFELGEDALALGMQGHWKDPMGPMSLKSARHKLTRPLEIVERICRRGLDDDPIEAAEEASSSSRPGPIQNMELEPAEERVINVKKPRGVLALVHRLRAGAPKTVCGLLPATSCRPAGEEAPVSCTRCMPK
jgi:hypothetical protein